MGGGRRARCSAVREPTCTPCSWLALTSDAGSRVAGAVLAGAGATGAGALSRQAAVCRAVHRSAAIIGRRTGALVRGTRIGVRHACSTSSGSRVPTSRAGAPTAGCGPAAAACSAALVVEVVTERATAHDERRETSDDCPSDPPHCRQDHLERPTNAPSREAMQCPRLIMTPAAGSNRWLSVSFGHATPWVVGRTWRLRCPLVIRVPPSVDGRDGRRDESARGGSLPPGALAFSGPRGDP